MVDHPIETMTSAVVVAAEIVNDIITLVNRSHLMGFQSDLFLDWTLLMMKLWNRWDLEN